MPLDPRLINPPDGDPALYLARPQEGSAWLFDCGQLDRLRPRDLLKVDHVFLTHAHIDHFIGFDRLLRLRLGTGGRVTLHGPPGLTAQVQGRLAGYAWNLVEGSTLEFRVAEIAEERIRWTLFPCRTRFQPAPLGDELVAERLELPGGWRLGWHPVDHGVPCLAWLLEAPPQITVEADRLTGLGLRPGPWLASLKAQAQAGRLEGELEVGGGRRAAADLASGLLRIERGPRLAYLTDTRLTPSLAASLEGWARGVDQLWCEAAYLETERGKAREHLHMTAAQAAALARQLEVGQLLLFHLSRRYQGDPSAHLEEARRIFPRTSLGRGYDPDGAPAEDSHGGLRRAWTVQHPTDGAPP